MDPLTIVAIAIVSGLISASIIVTSNILNLYGKYKRTTNGHIEKVLILNKQGERITLINPTVEEIREVLEREEAVNSDES